MLADPQILTDLKANGSMMSSEPTKSGESVQGRARPAPFVQDGGMGSPEYLAGTFWINLQQAADEIIPWGYYPYRRDRQLRLFARSEPILAGGLYNLSSRVSALPHRVTGKPRAQKYYQTIIGESDLGNGPEVLLQKTVYDLLTQDNGAFWELVGAGNPAKALRGPVMQINHLDSNRCWRTFDPEYPVIYYNPYTAAFHKMHYTRVVCMSDNTMPDELARGIGFCMTSRALRAVKIMRQMNQYIDEKTAGNFRRAMLLLRGFTPKQVDQAIQNTADDDASKGVLYYKGIPVLSSVQQELDYKMIEFASLGDGFDKEKETTLYVYILALAAGVDAREFWPATSSGATKADAGVQHMKSKGKGIATIMRTVEHAMNWQVLKDTGAEWEFDAKDDEEDLLKAQVEQADIANIAAMQTAGWIDANQGRSIAISKGLLDPALLQGAQIDATDNAPITADQVTEQEINNQQPVQQQQVAQGVPTSAKALEPCYVILSLANNPALIQLQYELIKDAEASEWDPHIEWTPANDFHVTLVYATNSKTKDLVSIKNVLPKSMNDYSFTAGPVTTFPAKDGKVPVILSVKAPDTLKALQAGIYAAFDSLGLEMSPYSKPEDWQPHITLGYAEEGVAIPKYPKTIDLTSSTAICSVPQGDGFENIYVAKESAMATKAWERTASDWSDFFQDIVNSGLAGDANRRQVGNLLKARLKRSGRSAYLDGLRDSGVSTSILNQDDEQALAAWLSDASDYVDDFVDELFTQGLTQAEVESRAEMWATKSLQEAYYAGVMSANENGMYEFVGDDGDDTCETCQRLKGQCHRMKDWEAHRLIPGVDTDNFICGGWQCKHYLNPTTQPETGNW